MITYQVRPRIFRTSSGNSPLRLPGDVFLRVVFAPAQPFGGEGDGRAVVQDGNATVLFNANTGQHLVESAPRLLPLDIRISDPVRQYHLVGPELQVRSRFNSLGELDNFIQSLVLGLAWLLNIEFADPPYVERVEGDVAGVPFGWELKEWGAMLAVTTTGLQEQKFADSFQRLTLVAVPDRRRLLAALHYFHKACRLNRASVTAGEFLAESLLNFSKVLEVLFPVEAGVETADAARDGLAKLGCSSIEIERDFVPAIILRNQIDVGHVYLGVFNTSQLTTLHQYAESCEGSFRRLLQLILKSIAQGTWEVPNYTLGDPKAQVARIIKQIAKNQRNLRNT